MIKKGTLRQQQQQEIKKKIFQSAIRLFEKEGYEKVTVQKICDRCGIAKGTFYLYFSTKEDIIRMSFGNGIDKHLDEEMTNYIAQNPQATAKEQLLEYIVYSLRYCQMVSRKITTLAFVFNLNQALSGGNVNLLDRAWVNKIVEDGIQSNVWNKESTYDEIIRRIEIFVTGVMMLWCYTDAEYDIVEVNRKVTKKFVNDL